MHQTEYWTQRGIEFIEQNKDRPFFLFLAYNGPYGLGKSVLEPAVNRHAAYYADKEMTSFPRQEPHPWLHNNRQMMNNLTSMRTYASEVSAVDDGVGDILATLEKHGLADNTVVIFTADQGWSGGHSGFWGMGDHTRPLTAYDWTMRVPLIWRHPGRIRAEQRSDLMVTNYDFMLTLLTHLGLESRMPAAPESPGRNYEAALQGHDVEWDNVAFYEFENVRAIRTERWKYIERIGEEPNELYDLGADPGERANLCGLTEHEETQRELQKRLHAFFDRYAEPKWDLWRGGDAKGGLLMGKEPYKDTNEEG
jgi:arylsulfatase A-like enzyme